MKKDIYIDHKGSGKKRISTLHICNECTIYNVEKNYSYLKDHLKKEKISKVEISDISNIDLAGLQLLVALKNELIKNNETVTFNYSLDNELQNMLIHCGFKNLFHN
jgi:ABC-type transporter Mla MlaB component